MTTSTLTKDEQGAAPAARSPDETDTRVELERWDLDPEHSIDPPAPVVVPSRQEADEMEPMSPQRVKLLDHLLKMADQYAGAGSLRQAIEMYFELVDDHQDTPHASRAASRLMAIADHYSEVGELRQARGIYERLLEAS